MAATGALGGIVTAQTVTWTLAAATAEVVDTVVASIFVPNKACILDVILEVTTLADDGALLTFDVGDAAGPETADDNRFISAFSGQAVGEIRASANLLDGTYTYRDDGVNDDLQTEQEIQLTIAAAAATGADGAGRLTVIYYNTV